MKIVHPNIEQHIVIEPGTINLLVIEDAGSFYKFVREFADQCVGNPGRFVLSDGNQILEMRGNVSIVTSPFDFDCNQRHIINSVKSNLIRIAKEENHYSETVELTSNIDRYLLGLVSSFDLPSVSMELGEYEIDALIKNSEIAIRSDSESLSENLIEYMSLLRELMGAAVFVFVNLKTFLAKDELDALYEMAIYRELHLLLLENSESRYKHEAERQILIDADLCEI